MPKTFNMEMNIAKAIGIAAIVAWHTNWEFFSGDFFNAGSWHVPLFFFISGYFFNINKDLISHFKNIVFRYLGWFYAYHFFYGAITVLIYLCFNRLYGKMPTLKTLTLSPVDSIPFEISTPNWFLIQLAISLFFFAIIMYLFKKFSKNVYLPAIVFIPLGVIAVMLAKPDSPSFGIIKVLIKTFISMLYIYSGWLYKNKLENKIKFNVKWFLGVVVAQMFFLLFCFKQGYCLAIFEARLMHSIYSFTIPFCGIYFVLFISKLLTPMIKENSIIDKIGKNSLHIMANHLFIIFLIQIVILAADNKPFSILSDDLHFYKTAKYKYLYTFLSLIMCTYIGEFLNRLIKKLKNYRETKKVQH